MKDNYPGCQVQARPACPGATSLANIAISILFISPGNTA